MRPIHVVLADDHPLMRAGVRSSLAAAPGFEVVGEAASGTQLVPLVARTRPDVVLTDLRMPGLDGLAALEEIKKLHPDVKVVVLSVLSAHEQIRTALERGADAYVVKTVNPADLVSVLRQVVEGTVFQAFGVPAGGEPARKAGLTERELAILRALARGLSNQAIAREHWVTAQTVKFHLANIYRKLGVGNRTEAVRCAYRDGLVESPLLEQAPA